MREHYASTDIIVVWKLLLKMCEVFIIWRRGLNVLSEGERDNCLDLPLKNIQPLTILIKNKIFLQNKIRQQLTWRILSAYIDEYNIVPMGKHNLFNEPWSDQKLYNNIDQKSTQVMTVEIMMSYNSAVILKYPTILDVYVLI